MADQELTAMTAASTLDGTEVTYVVQADADRKATIAQIRAASLPLAGGAMTGDIVLAGAPSAANHPTTKTYVDTALTTKAASVHTHVTGDVSGLDAALAGKSATGHTHTAANVTDFAEAVDDRVAALLVEGTGITLTYDDTAGTITVDAAGGGGTIDGSGTADRVARWSDTDTLAAGGLRDDGTRAAAGGPVTATATFTIKAQTGDSACLLIEGTGGVITPTVMFKHPGQDGVQVKGDNTGFQFAREGEGVTLYVAPGYPEAYVKTHNSAAGRLDFQTHDGSDYVTAFAIKGGKAQIDDAGTLKDISIAAGTTADVGFKVLQVAA